jgi:hypothetical protein
VPDPATDKLGKFRLTAVADTPDLRDWVYQPALLQLKREVDPPDNLNILNQGGEGSCTGFALAAVINLLRHHGHRSGSVSPRMLYEMAKQHDEWPGFDYEGSSCRGAIKGWYNMGVCLDSKWKYEENNPGHLTVAAAEDARNNTLGAYYRLGTRVSDFHAALNEVGVIYCSAIVHEGWQRPSKKTGVIPVRDEPAGGHAFAIIGYDERGFWVQNSWGSGWGLRGRALWTYEDWQRTITDAWVLRLALPTPQVWHLAPEGGSDASRAEGLFSKTPTRAEIAGHFVHIDDGEFHDHGRYWSNIADVRETTQLLAKSDKYDHVLLYAHGGLNDIEDSARRIAAMKETFKANGIYPYHFMYDTGLLEEIKDILGGKREEVEKRAGGLADWSDWLIERMTHKAGRALWREMKFGAEAPFKTGCAGLAVIEEILKAIDGSSKPLKLHLVGHSTGAILHAYLAAALSQFEGKIRIASASLLAPAATVDLFKSHYRPLLKAPKSQAGINRMDIYNLSDKLELDDTVIGIYRKSLLYLVSRSFEEDVRPAAILGMEKYKRGVATGLKNLTIHYSQGEIDLSKATKSETHGGFDNDPTTMNNLLKRVLGKRPTCPFTPKSLKY